MPLVFKNPKLFIYFFGFEMFNICMDVMSETRNECRELGPITNNKNKRQSHELGGTSETTLILKKKLTILKNNLKFFRWFHPFQFHGTEVGLTP